MLRRSPSPWTAAGMMEGVEELSWTSSKENLSFRFYFHCQLMCRAKEKITAEQHEKMFILYGTLETLTAEDNKGRTFTQILSSVCKENGGAVNILEIEK